MGRQTLIEPIESTDEGRYDLSAPDGEAFASELMGNYRLESDDF